MANFNYCRKIKNMEKDSFWGRGRLGELKFYFRHRYKIESITSEQYQNR